MIGLTPQQTACLEYIQDYQSRFGMAPTIRRIMVALKLKSTSGVSQLLDALEQRKVIRRLPRRARAIEIVGGNICPHCQNIAGSEKCRAAASNTVSNSEFAGVAPGGRPSPPVTTRGAFI